MFVAATGVVFLLPRVLSDFRAQQFAYVGIYFIALLGLNLLTGITGQISLGHGAFMLVGGYTTAVLMSNQDPPLEFAGHLFTNDVRDIWTIPIAGLVAGLVGFLFGFPALRLSGLYLALATFAIAVAAPAVVKKFDTFTGGSGGINLFDLETRTKPVESTDPITFEPIAEPIKILGLEIPSFNEWLYYLCWTVALVMFAGIWLLHYANRGWFFPLSIRQVPGKRSTFNVSVIGMGMLVTCMHGYLNGAFFSHDYLNQYGTEWLTDPRFLIGVVIYLGGFALLVSSESSGAGVTENVFEKTDAVSTSTHASKHRMRKSRCAAAFSFPAP